MDDVMYEQMNLFNFGKEYKHITKPIRLIELFSGIGATSKGLDIIGVEYEHYKTCEWAVPSIIAYNSIHIKDQTDYSRDLSKEDLINYLSGNISTNYNEPCDVKKKPESWLRRVYNNCIATHNLMNIMKVKGDDLGIVETDKYEYLITYSFPCQDLSLAGKRAGMSVSQAEGGTRSGLLWEVERILTECKELPQILIMENVPEVIGAGNKDDFSKWENRLKKLGYTNYLKIINGKDFGVPQNRKRAFMVSLLDDYAYDFPLRLRLKYKLKDFLEKQVDEKYYLSQKMVEYISITGTKTFSVNNSKVNCSIGRPLTTEQNKRAGTTNYIADDLQQDVDLRDVLQNNNSCEQVGKLNYYNLEQSDRIYGVNGLSPTIRTGFDDAKTIKITDYTETSLDKISNNIIDGEVANTLTANAMTSINHQNCSLIKENESYDGTYDYAQSDTLRNDVNSRYHKDNEISGTILASGNQNGIVVKQNSMGGVMIKNNNSKGYEVAHEGDGIDISSRMEYHRGTVQKGLSQTLTCVGGENVGVVVKDEK